GYLGRRQRGGPKISCKITAVRRLSGARNSSIKGGSAPEVLSAAVFVVGAETAGDRVCVGGACNTDATARTSAAAAVSITGMASGIFPEREEIDRPLVGRGNTRGRAGAATGPRVGTDGFSLVPGAGRRSAACRRRRLTSSENR